MAREIRVSFDSPNTRTLREWGGERGARRHAAEHGAAMVLRADGSGTLFFNDAGTIRRKSWPVVSRSLSEA